MKKLNCWEFKKCGRESVDDRDDHISICPAAISVKLDGLHGGKNGGRACWFVVGTLCNGGRQGTYSKKYKTCIFCDFYRLVKEEEYPRPQLQQVIPS